MKTSIIPFPERRKQQAQDVWYDRLARSLLLRQLGRIEDGRLLIREGEQVYDLGDSTSESSKPVLVTVDDPAAWRALAFGGTCAVGEAYMDGHWRCDDLTGLIRLVIRNRAVLEALEGNLNILQTPLKRLTYWLSRNTMDGSRRNIGAHYDIGNDLFALFLDPSMMYSSAYYPGPETSLEDAARAKLDRVCRKLDLTPHTHLLEIGTGWGGLAVHAARHYGCRVTTTTISAEQHKLACQRVREQGLSDRVTVLLQDYRTLEGTYDRLVSIEMIEAVGHQYMDRYFAKCSELLKPDGMMLIQAITVADQFYAAALKDVDFIKRFIFPGGFLPSITAMAQSLTRATDLRISHLEDIGLHYAQTLRDWRTRFHRHLDKVRLQGYSDRFIRMWDFYLCYSEAGFEERHLGTVQLLLSKTAARPLDVCY